MLAISMKVLDVTNVAADQTSLAQRVLTAVQLTAIVKGTAAGGDWVAKLLVSPTEDVADAIIADESTMSGADSAVLNYDKLAMTAWVVLERVAGTFTGKAHLIVRPAGC